jgi:hypothetical protein
MSAIEDGAMQNCDLVRLLRGSGEFGYGETGIEAADALEALAAELTRLRERNAELERESREYEGTIAHLEAATVRISSLEATVREMREAISGLLATPEIADAHPLDKDEETHIAERKARAALASSESVVKSEGENDGVE